MRKWFTRLSTQSPYRCAYNESVNNLDRLTVGVKYVLHESTTLVLGRGGSGVGSGRSNVCRCSDRKTKERTFGFSRCYEEGGGRAGPL